MNSKKNAAERPYEPLEPLHQSYDRAGQCQLVSSLVPFYILPGHDGPDNNPYFSESRSPGSNPAASSKSTFLKCGPSNGFSCLLQRAMGAV